MKLTLFTRWSFGVLLWELFSFAITPYPGLNHKDIVPFLNSGERMNKPDICPDGIYDIIRDCWEYNLDDRPTISDVARRIVKYVEDEVAPEVIIYWSIRIQNSER